MQQNARFTSALWPLILGFALLDIWCDLLGHSGATVQAAAYVQDALTNSRVFWNIALVIFCGLMVAVPHAFDKLRKPFDAGMPILGAVFTAVYGLALNPGSNGLLPIACVVLTGVAYGWLEIRLFCEAARMPSMGQIVAAVVVSRVIKAVVAAAIGLLSFQGQVALDTIAVLAAGACLVVTSRMLGVTVEEEGQKQTISVADRYIVLVLLVIHPLLNAVSRALSPLGFWGDASIVGSDGLLPVTVGALVFCAVAALVFYKCNSATVINRLSLSLLVLLAALLVVNGGVLWPFAADSAPTHGATMGIELFSHTLFWTAAILAARLLDWPPLRSAAIAELVMSFGAITLSLALQWTSGLGQTIIVVSMYGIMAVLMLVVWLSRGQISASVLGGLGGTAEGAPASKVVAVAAPGEPSTAEEGGVSSEGRVVSQVFDLSQACARVAAEAGLSPRETEVFELLAQGCSRPYIMEKLFISDATVKSHTNHVYQKLGVHSKQELIELVRGR